MKKKSITINISLLLLCISFCSNNFAAESKDEQEFLEFVGEGIEKVGDTITEIGKNSFKIIENKVEGVRLGAILLSNRTSSSGKHRADAVLIVNYEGYYQDYVDVSEYFGDATELELIPTSISFNINGERIQVLTDLATLEHYNNENDFLFLVSALSLNYDKNNESSLKKLSKLSYVNLSGTKFITLDENNESDLEFTVGAEVGLGGINRIKAIVENGSTYFSKDNTIIKLQLQGSVSAPLLADVPGANFNLSDTDIRLYAGGNYQKGEKNEYFGTYIGLNLVIGDPDEGTTWTPYFSWKKEIVKFQGPYRGKSQDAITELGIMIDW